MLVLTIPFQYAIACHFHNLGFIKGVVVSQVVLGYVAD